MHPRDDLACSLKDKIQHHILNWIVISRYQMVHMGIPKKTTLRYLVLLENFLKRMNILS